MLLLYLREEVRLYYVRFDATSQKYDTNTMQSLRSILKVLCDFGDALFGVLRHTSSKHDEEGTNKQQKTFIFSILHFFLSVLQHVHSLIPSDVFTGK